jgi:transcriptional regulator with XRE-family HTH domain
MRRIQVDMSQQVLGSHLDLTFQQIQKYEKGMNRIGASRLQQIGKILEVPAAYFVEGAPGGWEPAGTGGDRTSNTFLEFLGTRDGQSLVEAFSRIPDVKLRRSVVISSNGSRQPAAVIRQQQDGVSRSGNSCLA